MRGLLTGLLLFLSIYLYGIDYTVGKYNLSVLGGSGHFSLFYDKDKQSLPLFYSDNPRSSSLHLHYDERIINLGEDVLVNILETRQAVIVQYNLDDVLVEQEFSFLQEGSDILGVQSTYRIHNNSGVEISAGIRSVIDTSLGESRPFHFSTSDKPQIAQEYQFIPDVDNSYVLSAGASDQLAVYFTENSPSRVLMANWKRLSESEWDYEIQQDNNFSFRPFSINDSALAVFYEPVSIRNNQSVEYTIVFSYLPPGESPRQQEERFRAADKYTLRRGEDQYLQLATVNVEQKRPENIGEYSLAEIESFAPYIQDLVSLDILIDQIDTLLYSSAILTSRELVVIKDILAAIQNSSSRY